MRRALVLGGTGVVGSAVLAELARAHVPAVFTYRASKVRADELVAGPGAHQAVQLDLAHPDEIRACMTRLADAGQVPDILIHCAAVAAPDRLEDITDASLQQSFAINAQSGLVACQALVSHWKAGRGADVVFVGALDRVQSLPLPLAFAASQGALSAMVMALANELGPHDIRVNMVALGLLGQGLSERVGSSALYRDFEQFSALRRVGTPEEAARAITWLALGNRYMNGKVVPVNGGI